MGLVKKTICFCSLILGVVLISVLSVGYLGVPDVSPLIRSGEEITIRQVTFDSAKNALLLDAQASSSENIILNVAVISNLGGKSVATTNPVPSELPAHKTTAITIDLNNVYLGSGNYTVTLWTTKGNTFRSPMFAIP